MFKYLMYKIGLFIIHRLSIQASYKLAVFVSDLHYLFSFRDRKAVRGNLKAVLGSNKNIEHLTREVFRNFGRYLAEFFLMRKILNKEYIKENIHLENIHYMDDVLSEGKGGILITAHLGNFEMGSAVLAELGYKLTVIALPHKERPVNDLFNHHREHHGIKVVPTTHAVRRCLENLKNNEFVALAADRDFSFNGEVIKFLGKETLIPKGAAILSEKTGAPIVPVFLVRDKDNHFTLSLSQPIYPSRVRKEDISQNALIKLINKYIKIIEEKIRLYPSQWLLFRTFWVEKDQHPETIDPAKKSMVSQKTKRSRVRS